uniref:Uncharacterized protein n=1 Tax=Aegilops tauschii subsp. strangulata TaxID=200361 RepID=A0A453LDP6_AEGTS
MEEENIQEKESDGLEDFWNEYSVALESSKLDTLEEAANEKEVNNVCNHEIQIHEDLGHVCRVRGMIVRRPNTIIDYQWRKVCYLFKICDDASITLRPFSNICSSIFLQVLSEYPF